MYIIHYNFLYIIQICKFINVINYEKPQGFCYSFSRQNQELFLGSTHKKRTIRE